MGSNWIYQDPFISKELSDAFKWQSGIKFTFYALPSYFALFKIENDYLHQLNIYNLENNQTRKIDLHYKYNIIRQPFISVNPLSTYLTIPNYDSPRSCVVTSFENPQELSPIHVRKALNNPNLFWKIRQRGSREQSFHSLLTADSFQLPGLTPEPIVDVLWKNQGFLLITQDTRMYNYSYHQENHCFLSAPSSGWSCEGIVICWMWRSVLFPMAVRGVRRGVH